MAKETFTPHGVPGATPCPPMPKDQSKNTAPKGFIPAGLEGLKNDKKKTLKKEES